MACTFTVHPRLIQIVYFSSIVPKEPYLFQILPPMHCNLLSKYPQQKFQLSHDLHSFSTPHSKNVPTGPQSGWKVSMLFSVTEIVIYHSRVSSQLTISSRKDVHNAFSRDTIRVRKFEKIPKRARAKMGIASEPRHAFKQSTGTYLTFKGHPRYGMDRRAYRQRCKLISYRGPMRTHSEQHWNGCHKRCRAFVGTCQIAATRFHDALMHRRYLNSLPARNPGGRPSTLAERTMSQIRGNLFGLNDDKPSRAVCGLMAWQLN